jgi:hypothetical protein
MGGKTLTDPCVRRTQSEDEVVGALASFIAEAAIAETPFESEQPRHPLWEFPEEVLPSARAAASNPAIRKLSIYASLAAIFVAAIGGAWWGGLISRSAPVATDATAEAVVIAPVVELSAEASSPLQLIPSMEVRPSTWPPVASIVPTVSREDGRIANPPPKAIALSGTEPEQRQPQERVSSMSRGTSGAMLSVPIPSLGPRPSTEPPPTAPMVLANPAARSPAPQPPPALEASSTAAPPASRTPAPAVRPEPEALPSVVARTEQSEIQRTLGQYRSAYQLLDAEAAQAVWPSVDVRALSRAFDSLTSQQLAFETCQFDIAGEAATAQCRGSATYTPKVGNRGPKLEPRQWTFHLRKMGEDWKIQSAQTRR